MIIAEPPRFEVYGAIKIFDVARVLALSGGRRSRLTTAFTAERGVLEDVAARTAIIVPIKDEDMLTLENILRAIPLDSLVILVSASRRSPFDAFKSEVELARLVASSLKRDILVV